MMEETYMLYAPGRAYRQESFALRCIYEIAMACAWDIFEEDPDADMQKKDMPGARNEGNICFSHGINMAK